MYERFRENIVGKISYVGENSHYFDFNACFTVRLNAPSNRSGEKLFSLMTYRAIMREDAFFLAYLRDYHNQTNFPSLSHNGHLLLEYALEVGAPSVIQLFTLCKSHYN